MIKVWDALVRVLHWALVAAVATAWMTRESSGTLHQQAGYAIAGIVLVRCVWGLVGSRYARFRQFLHGPRWVLAYAGQTLRGKAPRYLGHNPLGGWMIVALLLDLIALSMTGWLSTTDRFWGYAWLQNLHATLAWLLLGLIAAHVLGVLFSSWSHRENLIRAMVDGHKRAPCDHDVD